MASTIRIMMIDDNKAVRDNLRELLNFEPSIEVICEAASGEEAVRKVKATSPDVILLDVNMPGKDGFSLTEIIAREFPQCLIIVMSVQGEKEHLRQAMFAGAKDYLLKPFEQDELLNCITQIYGREQKKREKFIHAVKETGKVITIFSTKSGIGKTTMAINLAAVLGMSEARKVCILDMDLLFGDAARFFNLVPNWTIIDLIKVMDVTQKLEVSVLDGYMTKYKDNIKLLASPLCPEKAVDVTADHLAAIVKELQYHYDYVIIDTASLFNDILFKILDLSNKIIIVASQELSTLKNVKTCLEILKSLNYPEDRFKVILSEENPALTINTIYSEELLQVNLLGYIVSDRQTAVSAEKQGIPFVISSPETPVAQTIFKLAHYVMEADGEYSPAPTLKTSIQHGVDKATQPLKSRGEERKVMKNYKKRHQDLDAALWTMP
ncbi:MAG: response regulator [Sporomusaceae bacterium]|nr:response regulator [Sporomusaceae bacterium]